MTRMPTIINTDLVFSQKMEIIESCIHNTTTTAANSSNERDKILLICFSNKGFDHFEIRLL